MQWNPGVGSQQSLAEDSARTNLGCPEEAYACGQNMLLELVESRAMRTFPDFTVQLPIKEFALPESYARFFY